MSLARPLAAVLTGLALLSGCAPPDPPQLTPQAVQVTELTPSTLKLRVQLDAYNPNSVTLAVRSMSAHVTLADRIDLGTAEIPTGASLPGKAHTPVVAEVQVPWQNTPEVARLALLDSVTYRIDGRARIGGEKLNVELPFTQQGTLTRQQLLASGLRGLAGMLEGGAPPLP